MSSKVENQKNKIQNLIWDFIENYYPNYHSSNEILENGSLKLILDKEISKSDDLFIPIWNKFLECNPDTKDSEFNLVEFDFISFVQKLFDESLLKIYEKSIANYMKQQKSSNLKLIDLDEKTITLEFEDFLSQYFSKYKHKNYLFDGISVGDFSKSTLDAINFSKKEFSDNYNRFIRILLENNIQYGIHKIEDDAYAYYLIDVEPIIGISSNFIDAYTSLIKMKRKEELNKPDLLFTEKEFSIVNRIQNKLS